jgi:t-SNARE complex subunit (syntaxin)
MAELKSHVSKLNSIDCTSGKQKSWGDTEYTNKVSEIKIVDRDYLVKLSEDQIEKLQDELDEFNATTNI